MNLPHEDPLILYAHHLPQHITYIDIEQAFRRCNLIVVASLHREPDCTSEKVTNLTACITFVSIADGEATSHQRTYNFPLTFTMTNAAAEKALATVNLCHIPNVQPEARLVLSRTPHAAHSTASNTCAGRLVKHLPPGMTAFELYDLIRPFGPIEYVEVDPYIGGILHFQDEPQARDVELSLARLALRPYDPCTLFCTDLCPEITVEVLRKSFEELDLGPILSVEIAGDVDDLKFGSGIVKYASPLAAFMAMERMDGSLLGSKYLAVSFEDAKTAPILGIYEESIRALERVTLERDKFEVLSTNMEEELRRAQSEVHILQTRLAREEDAARNVRKEMDERLREAQSEIKFLQNKLASEGDAAQNARKDAGNLQKERDRLKATLEDSRKVWEQNLLAVVSKKGLQADLGSPEFKIAALEGVVKTLQIEIAEYQRRIRKMENDGAQGIADYQSKIQELENDRMQEKTAYQRKIRDMEDDKTRVEGEYQRKNREMENEKKQEIAKYERQIREMQNDKTRSYMEEANRIWEENNARKAWQMEREQLQRENADLKAEITHIKDEMAQKRVIARMRKDAKEKAKREEAERKLREKEEKKRKEDARRQEETRRKEEEERKEQQRLQEQLRSDHWRKATMEERARCFKRDREEWGCGQPCWTQQRAWERFQVLFREFENSDFSEARPLTFEGVPWPILYDPFRFQLRDIESLAIKAFLCYAATAYTGDPGFKPILKKMQISFHPDKWKARNHLKSVMDDDLRTKLADTVTAVSQAINAYIEEWNRSP